MNREITLTINGEKATLSVPPHRTLLELIRGELHLTGTKLGCGIGECGACTVIMNGEPVNSCLVLAAEADGAEIWTIESEAQGDTLSDLQQAFVDFGATQCGFCTPGMIMSARALLERNPSPTREEIAEAIAGNLCRCTGYEPIIEAIDAVARERRSGGYKPRTPALKPGEYVGSGTPRVDAFEKVAGSAIYVHDMVLPGMLYARIKTSPYAAARIKAIHTEKAAAMPGVKVILTGKDLPPVKVGLYLQDKDILVREVVRFQGEPVVAVAAETEDIARAACDAIEVEYEPLEPVMDVEKAFEERERLVHPDLGSYSYMKGVFFPQPGTNIAHHQKIRKGNIDDGFAHADVVTEYEFWNPPVQHVAMETHTSIVQAKPEGKVDIISSAQSPYAVRNLFAHAFGIPHANIRVRVPYVGGGFGGKAGIHLEPLLYCLSKAAKGRPVKLTCTREEEFNTMPSRQGLKSVVKTGVTRDGKIVALKVRYLWDAGAYADYGVNIGRAAAYSGAGPYHIPNCWIDSFVVYTNKVFGTAYRGFGHLEVLWAIERNMDLVAKQLGMDPFEFRMKNVLRVGDTTITGEKITHHHGRPDKCLEIVAREIGWENRHQQPKQVAPNKLRGFGLALLHKAPAMPTFTSCSAIIKFNEDGSVNVLVSGVDYGQGTYTALAQIAADELKIPIEKVRISWDCDTDYTPYDWQTVASRFTVMGGNAVIQAARDCLNQMKNIASQVLRVPPDQLECADEKVYFRGNPDMAIPYRQLAIGYVYPNGNAIGGPVIGHGRYIAVGLTNLDPETGQGLPALDWTYGAHAAEIEVDIETGEIEVLRLISAFDAGKVINEQQCKSQIVGGVVQGLGSAMSEKFIFNEHGQFRNATFTDYKIPTARDIPREMKSFLVETPDAQGPYGARGIAEHPMVSIPSVIGNAIADATGVEMFEFPFLPETVYLALKRAGVTPKPTAGVTA
ncbi:MAG: xanthine dehydrogenase family protein molybdopterin-binding subunit [Candidatus Hydrogenedentota bacterium]|jgi:CO/xanthine dehydrogenase Mo-binding subunit/aerobic-type carbon monoxide dehydrogenase small subunit (CoxS/CutS family)|uniref:Xanthine dehydrogenase, molybdenum binding subunit n=1 Tax=Sumerlaea chitinivorans TaxID=2250252 RepID=A0A2Z4Y9S1_SUMC1|nr:Xanthine dehydrogenase, molybdenum binding subunit [Candidatus Sumerlaea chitinivorans]RMH30047.1 MAG: xanthine dehydrogenase family protein molybdopterin-binding subunit [Candidatus Hydrogenedentota bacterium]GIX43955.1 MAG: xanthine dehydrogenase, molybdenum binding subunit [Candidatus Sumerlaea sp.]